MPTERHRETQQRLTETQQRLTCLTATCAAPGARQLTKVCAQALQDVQLAGLLERLEHSGAAALAADADWAGMLSLGEQQRLAFAR